jgi:hypothetical protein
VCLYSFIQGTLGTLLLKNLNISVNFANGSSSFLSAESRLNAAITTCAFSSMSTSSARALVVDHRSGLQGVNVAISNC